MIKFLVGISLLLSVAAASAEDKIVKFSATWCPPCTELAPRIKKISSDLGIKLEEIDVDKSPALANEAKIEAIPTLILIRDGKEVGRVIGNLSDADLVPYIKSVFKK